jgi:hypothetical protein
MANEKRVRDLERQLSPRELVLADIEEARKHGSLTAHARCLVAKGLSPWALCQRIEESVGRASRRLPAAECARRIRDAQRDGLFLARLWLECNAWFIGHQQEWDLRMALLGSQLLLTMTEKYSHQVTLGQVLKLARAQRLLLAGAEAAVRLLERDYFDRRTVLYPDLKADLQGRNAEIQHFVTLISQVLDDVDKRVDGRGDSQRDRADGTEGLEKHVSTRVDRQVVGEGEGIDGVAGHPAAASRGTGSDGARALVWSWLTVARFETSILIGEGSRATAVRDEYVRHAFGTP